MRQSVVALLIIVSVFVVGSRAQAANYNLGTLPVPSSQSIGGWEIGWPSPLPNPSHVVDTYTFQVGSTAELTAQAVEFEFWKIINFASLTATLYDSSCACARDSASGTSGFLLSYADLLPGVTYKLQISGILGDWAIKGIYYGSLTVSAVPIPPALLLFGTAIAGAAVFGRRRKREGSSSIGEGELSSLRVA